MSRVRPRDARNLFGRGPRGDFAAARAGRRAKEGPIVPDKTAKPE
jgi:hypothetical protein